MQGNWVLLYNGDEFRIRSATTDYLAMVGGCIFAIIYIVDALMNRLWWWAAGPVVTLAIIIFVDPTGYVFPLLNILVAVAYYNEKPKMVLKTMQKRGWKIHSWSTKKKRNDAIDEWIASKAIVPK